jgi:hypothetical protein
MSDELAKMSLKELIAQGKLGQLDLKRGMVEVTCTQANNEIAEERIKKKEKKLKSPKIPKKGYKIRPLTIDEERDCDRLIGLYGEDISLIARTLKVNPVVVQTYLLNKFNK